MIIAVGDAVVSHPDLYLMETLILPAVDDVGCGRLTAKLSLGIAFGGRMGPCPRLSVTLRQGGLDPMTAHLGMQWLGFLPQFGTSLQSCPSSRLSEG